MKFNIICFSLVCSVCRTVSMCPPTCSHRVNERSLVYSQQKRPPGSARSKDIWYTDLSHTKTMIPPALAKDVGQGQPELAPEPGQNLCLQPSTEPIGEDETTEQIYSKFHHHRGL